TRPALVPVAGDEPEGDAGGERDPQDDGGEGQRGACPEDDPAQDVPADLVGAEPVRPARRLEGPVEVDARAGVLGEGGDRPRRRRAEDEDEHDGGAGRRQGTPEEPPEPAGATARPRGRPRGAARHGERRPGWLGRPGPLSAGGPAG